jgi:hypothetical protein
LMPLRLHRSAFDIPLRSGPHKLFDVLKSIRIEKRMKINIGLTKHTAN